MTARKLPPAGRPLRSFLFCELPSPRPPPEDGPPTRNKTGGGRPALREKPAPPGWELVPGEFENSLLSKGDLREVSLRGEMPTPGVNGGDAPFPGKKAALPQRETALPGWELVPGEFENSPPSNGDLREVPPGRKDKPPAPRGKRGRALFPEERCALLQIGSYPAGLGKPGRSGGDI